VPDLLQIRPAVVLVASALMLFGLLAPCLALHSAAAIQETPVPVTTPVGNYVKVTTSSASNITLLSVQGAQYSISSFRQSGLNIFEFVPANESFYTVTLNISAINASAPNYAYVSRQANPTDVKLENVTGTGNIVVQLAITTTPTVQSSSGPWDPLFGVLPLHLQVGSVTFTQAVEIVFAIGAFFFLLGIGIKSKIVYFGVFVLMIGLAMEVGMLFVFLLICAYFVGFAMVNLVWRFKKRDLGDGSFSAADAQEK
jgi:hypothetical protein